MEWKPQTLMVIKDPVEPVSYFSLDSELDSAFFSNVSQGNDSWKGCPANLECHPGLNVTVPMFLW